jgi:putative PIN family toxin of toxin-antitoxin system
VIRAVLDANTIISALLVRVGMPARVLAAAFATIFECCSSDAIVAEVTRTLSSRRVQRKYPIDAIEVARVRRFLESDAVHVPISVTVQGVATHPEDDLILATAVSARADYLVTGDRQLIALGEYQGVQIVTARPFHTILGLPAQP